MIASLSSSCRIIPTSFDFNSSPCSLRVSVPPWSPCIFLKLKHLQPVIPRVHRDDPPALVHAHSPWIRQSSRLAARAAPGGFAAAGLLVDLLHAVVAELADDQV